MKIHSFPVLPLFCALFLQSVFALSAVDAYEGTASDASKAAEMDWPYWRGPEMNGISRETGLVESWSPKGENLLYKREELAGRSTPIVMNGKLYVIARDQPETKFEGEKVICADAATGEILWENRFNVFLSDVPDTRVGWSSLAGDPLTGHVYALGVCDYLQCLDGETGKTIWSHSLSEKFGALNTYGGRTNFPVIHGNLVIVSAVVIGWGEMAKPCHRFIAFDKRNGMPVWFNGTRLFPYDTTYSAPTTTVINGQAMMIFASGDGGIHAMQPQTGERIWTFNMARRGIDSSPLVVGDKVFAGQGEENLNDNVMGALVSIDATKTGDISKTGAHWFEKEIVVGKSAPVMVEDQLVVVENTGRLIVVDPETGKKITSKKLGTMMRGSPLYADGKIYVCTVNGRWYVLKLDGKKIKTLNRLRLGNEKIFASPIVSHGRIYLRTTEALYCIGEAGKQPSSEPRPIPPVESPAANEPEPAHVQVVPVDMLLRPGQKQQYQVRLFNSKGQFLKVAEAADVQFSLDGPGEINSTGKYHTPNESAQPSAIIVTAKVGQLSGRARIRMVPDLALTFDFDDGEVPITWVGARYRNIAVDFDLYQSLKNADPRAAQLYIFFMTDFINFNRTTSKFDDTIPRRPQWTGLLRYLALADDQQILTTLEGAKAALDPALKRLQDEQVISNWEWSKAGEAGTRLVVHRGDRKVDGNGAMVKIRTIPLGTKSRSWMGHTFYHDYTIQADVMGNVVAGKLPDVGIIGQRYVFDMMGAYQKLQIRTWAAQERMARSVPFDWKPNVWYTMKMRTAVEDGKAVLRGKAWPRDQSEPEGWMVEAIDESPNLNGSPGLFGNARDAEIFYDNIKITNNSPN